MSQINKKPWLRPLLDYFQTIIDFNNRIESIKENLCSISNFNPLKLFIYLDFEKNGFLTSRNIIYFLEQTKTNIEEQYIRSLIHTYDKDGDYNLNFSEFLNIILPIKNKSLKEKLLLLLKEKSDKSIYDIIPQEIIILFNELIKEELFFSKTSLYAIKRIYDSPEFTTYDVFIDIVKNESYITKENLANFLEENNFHLNKDLDINNIMFRIDADNDNKISYPEFQDIFYPLKHLNINYSTNMEKYFSIKDKDKIKEKEKEKETLDDKIETLYGKKLNYDYNLYRYDFPQKNNKSTNNNKYIDINENKEIIDSYYQDFINKISKSLEKIETRKNNSMDNYIINYIEEKPKIKEVKEMKKVKEIKKLEEEKNNSKEKLKDIRINIKNNIEEEKKFEKKDILMSIKSIKLEKSLTYEIKFNANNSAEKSEKIEKNKNLQEEKKEEEEIKEEIKEAKEKREIKEEREIKKEIKEDKNINMNNEPMDNKIHEDKNIIKQNNEEFKEIKEINKQIEKENNNNKENIPNNNNYNNIKLYEDKNTIEINNSQNEKNIQFNDLKTQNCFRFSINKKRKNKFLIRNFSDIQHINYKNKEYTSITERILNNSKNMPEKNNRHNSMKKINKQKLNFNSLNLHPRQNNNRTSKIICSKTSREYDLTNYFKFKNSMSDSNSDITTQEIKESKTSRIINTNIKMKNKALFDLLSNYIVQENEKEKILEKLYLCPDFNIQNLFQTFLWPENFLSFKKGIITANDIYNTLINLGLYNINPKDVIYIFIKFNKKISKKEKINTIGFTYKEFCEMMKPKNIGKNLINKKYQKYFMGFCFKTKRIICAFFKHIIDSEKINETLRRQLVGNNENNKYKVYLTVVNLFNSLKNKKSDVYLDYNNFESFMNLFYKKLKKSENKIIMKIFDKNNDNIIDFNEFFNEIIPKLTVI